MNQSAFIKVHTIHDNFCFIQGVAKLLRGKKIPKLLLKVNIAKVLDSVSWIFLLEIFQHMEFSHKWMNWVSICSARRAQKIY